MISSEESKEVSEVKIELPSSEALIEQVDVIASNIKKIINILSFYNCNKIEDPLALLESSLVRRDVSNIVNVSATLDNIANNLKKEKHEEIDE